MIMLFILEENYAFRSLHICLGWALPAPTFLWYSYTCLLDSGLFHVPECLSLIFMCASGLSFSVTSSRCRVLYRVPLIVLLYLQLFHILSCRAKLHMFVLVYLWLPFSSTKMQAPEGLSPLFFVYLGCQCLVYSWSPIKVSLTCSCLVVILLEVWHSLFLNNWNWTLPSVSGW